MYPVSPTFMTPVPTPVLPALARCTKCALLADAVPHGARGQVDGYVVTVALMVLITVLALWRLWQRR